MAHIFLSYDNSDRDFARDLVSALEAAGWSVWWDRRIPTGKTWRAVLDTALAQMSCMVVLWSARSVESHWVIEEAEEGRSRGKLLPVLIDDVRPPRGFREIQALSFVGWDRTAQAACFRLLLQDLEAATDGKPHDVRAASSADVRQPAGQDTHTSSRADARSSHETYSAAQQRMPDEPRTKLTQRRGILAATAVGLIVLSASVALIGRDRESPDVPPVTFRLESPGAETTQTSPPTVKVQPGNTESGVASDAVKRSATSSPAPLGGLGLTAKPGSAGLVTSGHQLLTAPDDTQRLTAEIAEYSRRIEELQRRQRELERERALAPAASAAERNAEFKRIKAEMEELSKLQNELSRRLQEMDEKARDAIRHIKAG